MRAFKGCVVLVLTATFAMDARAGDCEPRVCDSADITLDGRYVLLRPNCKIQRVFDLSTGKLHRGAKARKLVKGKKRIDLPFHTGDSPFAKWLNKRRGREDRIRARLAYQLPNGVS